MGAGAGGGRASIDPRTPVIVGAAQYADQGDDLLEPIGMLERAAREALADAGPSHDLATRLTGVAVVNVLHRHAPEPAHRVGDRLGAPSGWRVTTTVGGNTPSWLLGRICDEIAAGRQHAVVMAGCETGASFRRARARGASIDQSGDLGEPASGADEVIGDDRSGINDAEAAVGLLAPPFIYPLLESTLAARDGRTLDQQREWLGRLMAPFTQVAARHPDVAWFPTARTPAELSTVSPDNRLIAEPYPKLMNAIMNVDQGAALVVMSVEAAEAAGVPRERWVFPWAVADCHDVFWISERPHLDRSVGVAAAVDAVFGATGIGVDDVSWFDLYSCFPSAVQMGAEAAGVDVFDPRGLTVTGGLPYSGGPGNNYTTHAIATLVGLSRERPEGIGLATALGWFVTKHSVGLYSATPPPNGWRRPDLSDVQAAIDATALPVAAGDEASGEATVDAFTVIHDREAGPASVPIIATLSDGRRACAVVEDRAFAAEVSGGQLVGARIKIRPADGRPTFDLM